MQMRRTKKESESGVVKTQEMKYEISFVKKINEEYKSRGGRITRTRETKCDWQEDRDERDVKLQEH